MYSNLIADKSLSPNHSGKRTEKLMYLTPHCFVGQVTGKRGCEVFLPKSREASCNYVIGKDGEIWLCVDEDNRSWCTSSGWNDQRAITFELASDTVAPYKMNSAVYNSLVELCVDICKRHNKKRLLWLGSKEKTMAYTVKNDELVITVHRWFANKACPGDWLYSRLGELAKTVTEQLDGNTEQVEDTSTFYRVQVGAYKNRANAEEINQKLKDNGFNGFITVSGNLLKVQVGAYKNKSNADNMLKQLKAKDFDGFIVTVGAEPQIQPQPQKTVDELAREVIRGLWGTGLTRKLRLTEAGYDYNAVQKRVNELL